MLDVQRREYVFEDVLLLAAYILRVEHWFHVVGTFPRFASRFIGASMTILDYSNFK